MCEQSILHVGYGHMCNLLTKETCYPKNLDLLPSMQTIKHPVVLVITTEAALPICLLELLSRPNTLHAAACIV